MNLLQAGIMGVVEGLTEFLPISSTGHLILTGHFLGIEDTDQSKAFEVIIQSGAIFAVIWHYRAELKKLIRESLTMKQPGFGAVLSLALAFLPSAVIGLLLRKWIKATLFGINPVIASMIIGGVAMILFEVYFKKRNVSVPPVHLSDPPVSIRQSLAIGFSQVLAMWPGMSRSMTTILGARAVGLTPVHAASFSFLLAIPTILGATAVDVLKERHTLLNADPHFAIELLVGGFFSFLVALLVIRAFLKFLRTNGLAVFGWYRVMTGLALWYFIK